MAILENNGEISMDHYPQTWSEFIGQDAAKRQLRVAAKSAKARNAVMGHVMLSSSTPGIGKTSLALLIGAELGAEVTMQSGPVKPHELQYLFMDMKAGDVLFLDEAHRLADGGKKNAEWLLHLLQDGMVSTPLGMIEVPRITVVAATTDAGKLPQPVLDRFEINPTLAPYSDDEGARIAAQLATKVLKAAGLPLPTDEVCASIAQAGNNSPRHIRRILCAVRDLTWAEEISSNKGKYELDQAFDFAGVSADGLPTQAQRYLTILMAEFRGAPAGKTVIAERLGEVGGGMTEVERILLDRGLIAFTKGGRMLTTDGMRRAKQLAAA